MSINGKLASEVLCLRSPAFKHYGRILGSVIVSTYKHLKMHLQETVFLLLMKCWFIIHLLKMKMKSVLNLNVFMSSRPIFSTRNISIHRRVFGAFRAWLIGGLPNSSSSYPQTVHKLLRRLHLMPYKDRSTSMCSYGTKRKLSTALALIGKPSILLLVRNTME